LTSYVFCVQDIRNVGEFIKNMKNDFNTKIDINIFNGDVEDLQKMTLN